MKYLNEAIIKSLTEWKNAEPHLSNVILNNIEQTIKGIIPETKKWNKDVQEQAFARLFRNNIIPSIKEKITGLKMPQVINLLSNAPTHIIEGIIKNNKNRLNNEDTKKKINNQLIPYVIIKNMDVSEIPVLKKPNEEDVDELIEYQTLYSITLTNMANKKINENLDESTKIINEKLYNFSEDEQGNVIMDKEVYDMINEIRFKIYNMDKKQWNYYEDLIEEIHKRLNEKNVIKKEKNKLEDQQEKNKTKI